MNVRRISHIGIAVKSLEERIPFYRDVLGLPLVGREEVEDQGVRVAMLGVGESRIELLEPTRDDSPIARFIAKRGEGIHHVAYEVADADAALDGARSAGVRLVDERPRPGAGGARIAFLHPRSTGGVLTEICEEPGQGPGSAT